MRKREEPYCFLTVEKLSENNETLRAMYYNDGRGAIYSIIFEDNLSGAASFNDFLALIKKKYPDKIEFRNDTGRSFKTPGLDVYFRLDRGYPEQARWSDEFQF